MKTKKILIVSATKGEPKDTPLYTSLLPLKDDVKLLMTANNKKGLSEIYNRQLTTENLIKHDIILFVHDDVYIDDLKLQGKLYTAVDNVGYDIVGLAGAKTIKLTKPCLWHLMSDRKDWSGAVSHPVDNSAKSYVTSFGPWPSRCLVIDGLFMAVDLKRVLETGWRFNEKFTFHHYDLASCLDANRLELKIGTYPIYVTHNSPGLRDVNDKVFATSEEIFYNMYNT